MVKSEKKDTARKGQTQGKKGVRKNQKNYGFYGAIEGARKDHNTQHRGKKGLRPVWAFLAETREYLVGIFRRRETISGQDLAVRVNIRFVGIGLIL